LFYWDLGIRPLTIAIILKISETFVKNTLKENNRTGPQPTPDQAFNTWLYLNQQIGEPTINFLSKDNQQREQQLKEEINELEEKNTQLTEELQKAKDREENQKQEFETKTEELEQKNLKIEDLKQRNTKLTTEKETEKREKEKLQNKTVEQYERMIKVERELGEQKTKVTEIEHEKRTMQKEHHETIQTLKDDFIKMNDALSDSKKMNNTFTEKITKLEREMLSLKEKAKKSFRDGLVIGGLGGVAVGAIGVVLVQKLSEPPSNSPYNVIPNQQNGVNQPVIYTICSWVNSSGTPFIGFGNGCGIVISPVLQKYIRQT
jgi:hypothetical protein